VTSTWLVGEDLAQLLEVPVDDLPEQRWLDAAAAYVTPRRPDLFAVDPAPALEDLPSDLIEGAVLFATRLAARQGSVLGLAAGEFGPSSILRHDPDIARLCGLGVHTIPAIG
jgi:hypothetical protein